jgi:hypothetical protein
MKKLLYILYIIISSGLLLSQNNNYLKEIKNERYKYKMESLHYFRAITGPIRTKYIKSNDYESMRKIVLYLDTAMYKIDTTKLPDILADKEDKWLSYKIMIRKNIDEYKNAIKSGDYDKIKEISENYFQLFFAIHNLILPSIERYEDFHILVYYLEKYCWLEKKIEEMNELIPEIIERKNRLLEAIFKYLGKQSQVNEMIKNNFETQKTILSPKVDSLINIIKNGDIDNIKKALDDVHKQYHKCDDALRPQFFKDK